MPLYEFYGDTCPHCTEMKPIIQRLQAEGYDIQEREVWKNTENAALMERLNTWKCPGVPLFINTDSNQWICGSTDEEVVRQWAKGEDVEH